MASSTQGVPDEVMAAVSGMMEQLAVIGAASSDIERERQYDVLAGMLASVPTTQPNDDPFDEEARFAVHRDTAEKDDECSAPARPAQGDCVEVTSGGYSGRCGTIISDEHDDEPFKVQLFGGKKTGWLQESAVRKIDRAEMERRHEKERAQADRRALWLADKALVQQVEAARVEAEANLAEQEAPPAHDAEAEAKAAWEAEAQAEWEADLEEHGRRRAAAEAKAVAERERKRAEVSAVKAQLEEELADMPEGLRACVLKTYALPDDD
jgi:hypothetical protein